MGSEEPAISMLVFAVCFFHSFNLKLIADLVCRPGDISVRGICFKY